MMRDFVVAYIFIIVILFFMTFDDLHEIPTTPRQIYDESNMNMFGCTIQFLIMLVFNPIFHVVEFIYWIIHVGRKGS